MLTYVFAVCDSAVVCSYCYLALCDKCVFQLQDVSSLLTFFCVTDVY